MKNKTQTQIFHFDLYGKREEKYNFLNDNNLKSIEWNELKPQAPNYFLVNKDFKALADYEKGFSVNELFPLNNVGIVTARDSFTIHETKEEVKGTIDKFLKIDDETARTQFHLGKDVRDWQVNFARKDLTKHYPQNGTFTKISYRPFDKRWTFYTGKSKGFHCYPRAEVMQHFLKGENVGIALCKQFKSGDNYVHIFISNKIIESSYVSNRTSEITSVFPLYLYPDTAGQQRMAMGAGAGSSAPLTVREERTPNLNPEIVKQIAAGLGMEFTNEPFGSAQDSDRTQGLEAAQGAVAERSRSFAPIDLLDYIYAVLHAPSYRKKYKEFLKIDFPRVPYPKDKDVFWQLVQLGGALRQIHLLESPVVEKFITQYPVDGDNVVGKVSFVTSPCPSKGGELPLGAPSKGGELPLGAPSKGGEQFVAAPSKGGEFPLGTPSKGGESHIAAPSKEGEPHSAAPSKEGADELADSFSKEGIPEKRVPGFHTANPYTYKYVKEIRQELKRNPTPAEKNMWEYLRNKKTGHKIRRQHVIHDFIPDFVCLRKRTIIEIDGKIHLQQKEYDDFRTEILNDMGYDVIRFTNEEVFASPEKVTAEIKKHLDSKPDYVIDKTVDEKADTTSSPEWAGKTSSPLGRPGGVNPPTACGRVYINDTQYFANVPEVAWNFYIGGYQPAQKWLKDRKGRTLEFEDIRHYQKIIVALTETERIMREIDSKIFNI